MKILYHLPLRLSRRKFIKIMRNQDYKHWFYRLPAELLEDEGPVVACVYAVLLNGSDEGTHRTDMKVDTIAKKCGIAVRTVRTVIDRLAEINLVQRTKQGRRTVYDIHPILLPREHNADYLPEHGKLQGDTFEDVLRRIPNCNLQNHYKNCLLALGYALDGMALFSLQEIEEEYKQAFGTKKTNELVGQISFFDEED